MRRESIYPHRSVRSFPITRMRLWIALGTALIESTAVASFGPVLLAYHNHIAWWVLKVTHIPSADEGGVEVFSFLGRVTAPAIPLPPPGVNPLRTSVFFVLCLAGLLVVHRLVPLGRSFVMFLLILLCAAGAVIAFDPSFYFDSTMYVQIWLRGEYLVWLLLPWVAAFLFVLTMPSPGAGLAWSLLIEVYAIIWSSIRLAFCLGALHYTGILFLPLLWFCFGILFDLVYVLLFYSIALHFSSRRGAGERKL
jgi:hypothetical protein